MLLTAFTGRCPACREGHVFKGFLEVRERCDRCGVVFLREEGDWIGATVVTYMLFSVFVVVLLLGLWLGGVLTQKGSEWIVAGATCAFILITMRPAKGAWIGMMHSWGYIYADPEPRIEAADEG